MSFVKWTLLWIFCIILYLVILLFVPGIPPDYNFESFSITPPVKAEGWFATNTILDKAEVYFKGENIGPESVAIRGDEIFTGDTTGNILKIVDGKSSIVTQLQFPCAQNMYYESAKNQQNMKCGYPLGMRFDKTGHLMVMDFYGGLIKVNVDTGKSETLVSKWAEINGKYAWNPEDVDIAEDGTIFWSDGSTVDWGTTELFGQPSGRLLKYDPITKKNTVLVDDLHMSNGVCLSANQDFILVSELPRSQIRRYYLKGAKVGQNDIFIDGLPGYPDNIRSNGRGGFYVAIVAPWNDDFSWNLHKLSSFPHLRKLILRSRYLAQKLLIGLSSILPPNIYIDFAMEYVNFFGPLLHINDLPKIATIVELSNTGDIIGILNGKSGNVYSLSQIALGEKYGYINAPFSKNVWRIKIEDLRKMK